MGKYALVQGHLSQHLCIRSWLITKTIISHYPRIPDKRKQLISCKKNQKSGISQLLFLWHNELKILSLWKPKTNPVSDRKNRSKSKKPKGEKPNPIQYPTEENHPNPGRKAEKPRRIQYLNEANQQNPKPKGRKTKPNPVSDLKKTNQYPKRCLIHSIENHQNRTFYFTIR
mgnify:CR=1 FL=1